MVPLRFDPVCCQVRVNVPLKAPLYCPDQVPESTPVGAGVAVVVGVEVVVGVAAAGDVGAVAVVVGLLPQPRAINASSDRTAMTNSRDKRGARRGPKSRPPSPTDSRRMTPMCET
jgi:hypothetical protein